MECSCGCSSIMHSELLIEGGLISRVGVCNFSKSCVVELSAYTVVPAADFLFVFDPC